MFTVEKEIKHESLKKKYANVLKDVEVQDEKDFGNLIWNQAINILPQDLSE